MTAAAAAPARKYRPRRPRYMPATLELEQVVEQLPAVDRRTIGRFVSIDDRASHCRFCSHLTSDVDRVCSFCRVELEQPGGLPYCRDQLETLAAAVDVELELSAE